MHAEGAAPGPSKKAQPERREDHEEPMPTTDDEIQEKYLERAIRELNELTQRLRSARTARAAT